MILKAARFLGLAPVAPTLGPTFCHVTETPGKPRLPGTAWLTVRQDVYVAFGPALAAWIEATDPPRAPRPR